jgi:hypothetical protein
MENRAALTRRIRRALGLVSRRERVERRATDGATDTAAHLADENDRGGHRYLRP